MKITLDDSIFYFELNGITFPKNIKTFEVEADDLAIKGISDFGDLYAHISKNKLVSGNILLKKLCDKYYILPKCSSQDEIVYSLQKTVFNMNVTTSLISSKGVFYALIENDGKFISLAASTNTTFLFSKNGIIVKTSDGLYIVCYDGDFFSSKIIPYTTAEILGDILKVSFEAPTTEGIIIKTEYLLSVKKYELSKKENVISRKGNYFEKTLAVAFIERVLFCDEDDILEMLSDGFEKADVPKIKSFVGEGEIIDFDGEKVFLSSGKSFSIASKDGKICNVYD